MIFETLRKFQFRFKDRIAAAEILAESLKDRIRNKDEQKFVVVLGIPRAGIITADVVAKKLSSNFFGIVVSRKLTHPHNKEQAIGAIAEDGTSYINQRLMDDFQISSEYLEQEKVKQMQEIRRRKTLYNAGQRTSDSTSFLKDKTVILVDDGAATGATIIAAAKWIRQVQNNPKRLMIAVPVAPKSTVNLLKEECNAEVEVIISPPLRAFRSVEQYHLNFQPITDEQVMRIMRSRNV